MLIEYSCKKHYVSYFEFLMFTNSVYFLQQPILFVAITLLLLRYYLSYSYSATKKVLRKNKICILLYRHNNTIIPYLKFKRVLQKHDLSCF